MPCITIPYLRWAVAKPDPKWGRRLRLRRAQGRRVGDGGGAGRALPGAMAGFKIPKSFVFGPLPKTSTGKIQKFVLRDRAKSASAIE